MKRRDLIRYLEQNGCWFKREGGNHSIYAKNRKKISVPRHREIDKHLIDKICVALGIPKPGKK